MALAPARAIHDSVAHPSLATHHTFDYQNMPGRYDRHDPHRRGATALGSGTSCMGLVGGMVRAGMPRPRGSRIPRRGWRGWTSPSVRVGMDVEAEGDRAEELRE